MDLRCNRRLKDGKEHRYWNIVESKRCAGGKVVQRNVLYLGEINDSQRESWCQVIEAFDEGTKQPTQLALFPAERIGAGPCPKVWRAGSAQRDATASPAPVGRVLVGLRSV